MALARSLRIIATIIVLSAIVTSWIWTWNTALAAALTAELLGISLLTFVIERLTVHEERARWKVYHDRIRALMHNLVEDLFDEFATLLEVTVPVINVP
jgi:hypothetical protein